MLPISHGVVGQVVVDTSYTLSELSYNAVANAGTQTVTELMVSPTQMIIATEPGTGEKLLAYAFDDSSLPNFGSLEDNLSLDGENPRANCFGDSGDYLYIAGHASPFLERKALSTAYDISTESASTTKNTSGLGFYAQGIEIKSDGSLVFFVDSSYVRICSLTTNYDITTLQSPTSISLGVTDDDGHTIGGLTGIRFKPDGTKFFISYRVSNIPKVAEFSLSTAWDLSTKSFVSSLNIGDKLGYYSSGVLSYVAGLDWNSDGSRLYVAAIHVELTIGEVQVAEYVA